MTVQAVPCLFHSQKARIQGVVVYPGTREAETGHSRGSMAGQSRVIGDLQTIKR